MTTVIVSDPEARAHLGVGFGAFARAHLGVMSELGVVVQPQPSTPAQPAAQPRAVVARFSRGGAFGHAAFIAATFAYRPTLDDQLKKAVDDVVRLAQDEQMHQWLSGTLTTEATGGRSVQTDYAVAEIILERLQVDGAAPIVKATQLAAGYVALGLQVVLIGHDARRPLAAVHVDGRWAYADPSATRPLGGHEPFTSEKFYQIPPLPDPAPTRAELELQVLRIEIETLHREVALLQEQIAALEVSFMETDDLYRGERARREALERRLQQVLVIGGIAVSAAVILWWVRASRAAASKDGASSLDETDE